VADTKRASAILALYQSFGRYEAVAIHSGLAAKSVDAAKKKLLDGSARVVVCVDMLGEGFDLPELKIAAFHDIRKSLAVTLQLAGRFTRVRADLGDPVFIANTALIDVRDELRKLYAQDPDWNVLLPELSTSAIDEEITSQEFFRGFGVFLDEVPLKDLRPAASMVVYKTQCANWTPKRFRHGLRGLNSGDKVYHSLNEVENTLVVLTAMEQGVRWSDVDSVRETVWELFVAVWDRDRALLYLHGSGLSGEYRELAKALCGAEVQLVVAPEMFRCFYGIKRLVLGCRGAHRPSRSPGGDARSPCRCRFRAWTKSLRWRRQARARLVKSAIACGHVRRVGQGDRCEASGRHHQSRRGARRHAQARAGGHHPGEHRDRCRVAEGGSGTLRGHVPLLRARRRGGAFH
jgi:hypothetical protein